MCFSINDKLNLSLLTKSLLSYDSILSDVDRSVYFNVSMHAPFEELTRILISLFVCGSLLDSDSGLTFSFQQKKSWKFIIEIPHTNRNGTKIRDNHAKILPILSILSPSTIDEVTDENYPLFMGEEEELVARFLKAYETSAIDRMLTYDDDDNEQPVSFERLTDSNECRFYINNCLNKYAREFSNSKVLQLSFIKFLHRRFLFFNSAYYKMNEQHQFLGSSLMAQMINEAKSLARIDFKTNDYPRMFLVYDPYFSLHLLHDDWSRVPKELQQIFHSSDPLLGKEFTDKNQYAKCLSWVIDIKYSDFERIMNETKFILTENFAYKIFHVHERKLTKLPLIIEGETGVGKTFLLKFYSLLLNSKVVDGALQDNIAPRILDRTSLWLVETIITEILEDDSNLLNKFLQRIKVKLTQVGKTETTNFNNDEHDDNDLFEAENDLSHSLEIYKLERNDNNDENPSASCSFPDDDNSQHTNEDEHELTDISLSLESKEQAPSKPRLVQVIDIDLLLEIKDSLQNFKYDNRVLRHIWGAILTVSNQNSDGITQKLIKELYRYVRSCLATFPLIEPSSQLEDLLAETSLPSVHTCIKIFNEYLLFTRMKPLFYRLLLHPGVTEEQLEQFLSPVTKLAHQLPNVELVVFFDEINTSSCLGLFKEIFIDRALHGSDLPRNIFFTGAINPAIKIENKDKQVLRTDYIVHQLPESLENLKVSYGVLESKTLKAYIKKKIAMFEIESGKDTGEKMPLDPYSQQVLSSSILSAQEFCETHLGIAFTIQVSF